VEQQRTAGSGAGLGQLLRRHPAEGEARIHQRVAELFGRGDTAVVDRVEPGPLRVGQALVESVEGLPFVEVGHVDGVTHRA
jgi:hypothetical protein